MLFGCMQYPSDSNTDGSERLDPSQVCTALVHELRKNFGLTEWENHQTRAKTTRKVADRKEKKRKATGEENGEGGDVEGFMKQSIKLKGDEDLRGCIRWGNVFNDPLPSDTSKGI